MALRGTTRPIRACPRPPLRSPARWNGPRFFGLRGKPSKDPCMTTASTKRVRCAINTRVSDDQGLEQDFNSLDAQYDASQSYIRSQAHAGWTLIPSKYADGGFTGGNTDRPALQQLLGDIRSGKIDVIVVYKVDRLTGRSQTLPSSSSCSTSIRSRSYRSPNSSIPPRPWAGSRSISFFRS